MRCAGRTGKRAFQARKGAFAASPALQGASGARAGDMVTPVTMELVATIGQPVDNHTAA
jgi:hypothetical protein